MIMKRLVVIAFKIPFPAASAESSPATFFMTLDSGGRVLDSSSRNGVFTSGGQTSETSILKRLSSGRKHSANPINANLEVP